jgi:Flp pilus assembly pilin Flp
MILIAQTWTCYVGARFRGERGGGLIEYGLLVALIAAVVVLAVQALGSDASAMYTSSGDRITN